MALALRQYQQELVDSVEGYLWNEGGNSILMQLPTGGGKTYTAASIFLNLFKQGGTGGIFVHRIEVVKQLFKAFTNLGIPTGVIAPGYAAQRHLPMQVGSIQAYNRRDKYNFDLLGIDEAHHASAKTYTDIRSSHSASKYMGITATPYRLKGNGLHEHFDKMVCGPTTLQLQNDNFLCPYDLIVNPLDLSKLRNISTVGGDYNEMELEELMDNGKITADIVESWKEYAFMKKTIVFCVGVNHSKHVAEKYNLEGIKAVHLESNGAYIFSQKEQKMVKWEIKNAREKAIELFEQGVIRVITNVAIATEGTDIPGIECVILARPTKSLSLYLQMCGRGSRILPGKFYYTLLDCANNVMEHGLPDDEHDWFKHFYGTAKKGKSKTDGEKIVKVTDTTGEIMILDLEEVERTFPQGIKGLKMERITGDFRIGLFNECLKDVKDSGFKKGAAYYRFCDILRSRGSFPNYMELLAISRKLGHKEGWAYYENKRWLQTLSK